MYLYDSSKPSIMKKKFFFSVIALSLLVACGGDGDKTNDDATASNATAQTQSDTTAYDLHRGEGKWTAEKLHLDENIDEQMAAEGEKIAAEKCASCHKTTEDTEIGPGWKGVTTRRSPEWVMNFITNPEGMIDKDPQLKALWEQCYVRMPDLNLTDVQARQLLEYLRKNDRAQ